MIAKSPTPTAEADAALLPRLRAGDPAAYEVLVCRHAGRMLAVAGRFLSCPEDRADAVQEALLAAYRALPAFEGQSSLATWLHRITVNACLMKLRSRSRRPCNLLEDLLPAAKDGGGRAHPVHCRPANPEAALETEEVREHVRACINRLPDAYRTVLVLRDLDELDTDQTARHLGLAPGAVKTRLHRARQALRSLLNP
jgi:RNA polymerase sigma-70 factor (ECF subfamily)